MNKLLLIRFLEYLKQGNREAATRCLEAIADRETAESIMFYVKEINMPAQ